GSISGIHIRMFTFTLLTEQQSELQTGLWFDLVGKHWFKHWLLLTSAAGLLKKVLVSGSEVTFAFINANMNWTQAQSYCRNHYTDLARVRNMADIQEIQTLIPSGQRVWIGFHRAVWMWADGSRFSFSYWRSSEPNGPGENCTSADLGDSGQWEDWDCDVQTPFICHNGKPPVSL
uniref:C-type lectin domain-containing protein n=1 Tax=Poecilia mexicana TaxID=48701 RepID=A0A3B3YBS2_9TELE